MSHMAADFERFLIQKLELDPDSMGRCDWAGTGNTFGALALRLGALTLDQIDRILEFQEDDHRLFGELAVDLGYMTNEQVERLIDLQRHHQLFEIGELIVLEGRISVEQLLELMTEFHRESAARASTSTTTP